MFKQTLRMFNHHSIKFFRALNFSKFYNFSIYSIFHANSKAFSIDFKTYLSLYNILNKNINYKKYKIINNLYKIYQKYF